MATSRSSSSERAGAGTMTMSSTFRRAHCLADGQLTPPSSPDHSRQPVARHVPRLRLSKFLRRPKSSKVGAMTTISQPTAIRTVQMPACISDMKVPLRLLCPESPVDTEYSSSSTMSPAPAPELRRVSESFHDLRSVAAQQPSPKLSHVATPLLPSPITYDMKEPMHSPFRFHNPRLADAANDYKSYEDLHILSCYYDDSRTASLQEIEQQLNDEQERESEGSLVAEDGEYLSSTETEDMPVTPKDQVRRGTCCSDESDWLASTKTHAERLRRFKARCYQVVQHPTSAKSNKTDDEIMLATVLVGPGKPKLVQISRPSSKSSCTPNDLAPQQRPHTPEAAPAEVSAFSPYDTPGPNQSYSSRSRATPPTSDLSYSTASLIPAPLALASQSHSMTRTATSSTAFSRTISHFDSLSDPFEPSQATTSHHNPGTRSTSVHQSLRLIRLDTSRTPSPQYSHISTAALRTRARRLERTLNAITQAIDSFPSSILNLASPCILELRSPQIPDSTYISSLHRIFPSARESLLSALAAWLLVDIYFSKIIAESASRSPHDLATPLQMTRASSLNSWDHLTLLAARSNDSLHRIPTKARDLLGIGRPDLSTSRGDPLVAQQRNKETTAALLQRVVVVSHSVSVVGQKLIEALRGAWDEDIWRALRCLVEVIEGCAGANEAQREWVACV